MIDSHCHLADEKFTSDLTQVISRAQDAGIERMVCIADDLEEARRCQEIAEQYPDVTFTVGVHPHNAQRFVFEHDEPAIRNFVRHPKCKAIGEIGLDYHYMNSPKDTQQRVFESQLVLAKELSLPAVIHCREAVEDVWTIVKYVKPQKLVLHCCTEKWEDVERFVEAGYFLSFTGIATYPNAEEIRRTIRQCPLAQMMNETDSPYLAPLPHRGQRNEPAFVKHVAECTAEIKKLTIEEVDRQTSRNAIQFFGLSP